MYVKYVITFKLISRNTLLLHVTLMIALFINDKLMII